MKQRYALAAPAAALAVAAALLGPTTADAATVRPDSTAISGSLSCLSGSAVEGVWVAASSGNSGWATLSAASGTESTVEWWYTLTAGSSYAIHVGCGGSPQNWAVVLKSGTRSGNSPDLICYDVVYEDPYYGTCR